MNKAIKSKRRVASAPRENGPPRDDGPPRMGKRSSVTPDAATKKVQADIAKMKRAKRFADRLERLHARKDLEDIGYYRDPVTGLLKPKASPKLSRTRLERRRDKKRAALPADLKCPGCSRIIMESRRWVAYNCETKMSLKEEAKRKLKSQEKYHTFLCASCWRSRDFGDAASTAHDSQTQVEDRVAKSEKRRLRRQRAHERSSR